MNRRKNLLCVFFLVLTVLSCTLEVDVFATSSGPVSAAGETGGQSAVTSIREPESSPASSAQADQQTQANPVSSQPAASSSRPASSSTASSRTVRRKSSSTAPVSSDLTSEESSEAVFGETSEEESSISLPGVGSVAENDPLSSAITNASAARKMNVQGILAWACIALGVIVVLIVVLSNRRPPRGPGRKRYRRPKRGSKKRLLNDRYYRNLNRY